MKVKNLVLGIGIIVVYALVLWQGIAAFYPSPDYNDYCNITNTEYIDNVARCEELGGQWEYNNGPKVVGENITGYCNLYSICSEEYEDAREPYSRNVFFICLIIGIITFIIGSAILKVEPVGSALLGSGIWALFYGTVWNWSNFSNIWRFLLLLFALVLLVWIAIRANSSKKKKSWAFWKK